MSYCLLNYLLLVFYASPGASILPPSETATRLHLSIQEYNSIQYNFKIVSNLEKSYKKSTKNSHHPNSPTVNIATTAISFLPLPHIKMYIHITYTHIHYFFFNHLRVSCRHAPSALNTSVYVISKNNDSHLHNLKF